MQTLLKVFNRAVQNTEFGIELAESEVIASNFRGNDQADVFKIRSGSLIGSLRRFDAAAAPAKQVDLIASDERKGNVCLRNWTSRREVAAGGAIPRKALALCAGRSGKRGELRCNLQRCSGTCLFQASGSNFDGLIRVESLFFQCGQFVILEDGPPFAFGHAILGRAFTPRLCNLPLRGHGSGWALILRPHRATEAK